MLSNMNWLLNKLDKNTEKNSKEVDKTKSQNENEIDTYGGTV